MTVPEETRTDADPACSNCGGGGWYLDEAQVRVCCPLCNADGNKRVDLADRTPQELAGIVRWALGATPKGDALAACHPSRTDHRSQRLPPALCCQRPNARSTPITDPERQAVESVKALRMDYDECPTREDMTVAESRLRTAETDCAYAEDFAGNLTRANIDLRTKLRTAETALRDLEWYEEVDVNGEYTTSRPRDTLAMRAEVAKVIEALSS